MLRLLSQGLASDYVIRVLVRLQLRRLRSVCRVQVPSCCLDGVLAVTEPRAARYTML